MYRIVVPLDGSDFAEGAVSHASTLARCCNARLTLFRVLVDDQDRQGHCGDSPDWRLHQIEARRYLKGMTDRLNEAGIEADFEIDEGRPADRIAAFVREQGADLVVMSAYGGSGQTEFPFGGVAHKVLVAAGTSYMVIREAREPQESVAYRRILVPLDGSAKAEPALGMATRLAGFADSELILLHAVAVPAMPRRRPLTAKEEEIRQAVVESNTEAAKIYLEEVERRLSTRHQVRCLLKVSSNPVRSIAEVAESEGVDLTVLSAYGGAELNGWSRESICQSVMAVIRTPVLAIQNGTI